MPAKRSSQFIQSHRPRPRMRRGCPIPAYLLCQLSPPCFPAVPYNRWRIHCKENQSGEGGSFPFRDELCIRETVGRRSAEKRSRSAASRLSDGGAIPLQAAGERHAPDDARWGLAVLRPCSAGGPLWLPVRFLDRPPFRAPGECNLDASQYSHRRGAALDHVAHWQISLSRIAGGRVHDDRKLPAGNR